MEILLLPSRLFHDREEPNGDRVNRYFKLNTVRAVLKALQPSEVEIIRPCFGKLLDVYSKPVFSGKLAHFLLTRQLDVSKRHEIWFIFAGKPIRFGFREFGIVTGLDCSPLPPLDSHLTKSPPGVAPYWYTLFGGEDCVTGEMLLVKLRKPKSLSSELRIKYACLLLVDGLLCRRSFNMKIPKGHVEMIRDIDVFLKYPWGRFSFDMTMQCIKSRTVNQLAQSTVVIRGFIHALQLVLIEAVPDVVAAIGDGTDSESDVEEVFPVISLKLDKVWDLDGEEEVEVNSIISNENTASDCTDVSWTDEVSDERVDAMVQMIEDGVEFSRDLFVGGRRRNVAPVVVPARNARKDKRKGKSKMLSDVISSGESSRNKKLKIQKDECVPENALSNVKLMAFIDEKIKEGLKESRDGLKQSQDTLYANLRLDMVDMEYRIQANLKRDFPKMVADELNGKTNELVGKIVKDVTDMHVKDNDAPGADKVVSGGNESNVSESDTVGEGNQGNTAKPKGTEGTNNPGTDAVGNDGVKKNNGQFGEELNLDSEGWELVSRVQADEDTVDVVVGSNVKFQRLIANDSLDRELTFAPGMVLPFKDLLNLPVLIPPQRPEVMDACVFVMRDTLFANMDPANDHMAELLPSKFFVPFAVSYSKFKKTVRKDLFEFDPDLIGVIGERCNATGKLWVKDIDFLYFSFNIDRNRWIGVMVDIVSHSLTVFDSSGELKRGSRLKPELDFICEMFPYLIRKVAATEVTKKWRMEPLSFNRNSHVAQADDTTKTGMLSLLFMEAHATGGLEKVYLVNQECIRARAEQLAVEMYEHCFGELE